MSARIVERIPVRVDFKGSCQRRAAKPLSSLAAAISIKPSFILWRARRLSIHPANENLRIPRSYRDVRSFVCLSGCLCTRPVGLCGCARRAWRFFARRKRAA